MVSEGGWWAGIYQWWIRRDTVDKESGCMAVRMKRMAVGLPAGNGDQGQDRVVQTHNGEETAGGGCRGASRGWRAGGGAGGGTGGVG